MNRTEKRVPTKGTVVNVPLFFRVNERQKSCYYMMASCYKMKGAESVRGPIQ
jgi:hypothetical protein